MTQKLLEECQKEYDRNKKIPASEYREYVVLQSKAEGIWEEAKEKADFDMFQPYLEKLVSTTNASLVIGDTKIINIIPCWICMSRV